MATTLNLKSVNGEVIKIKVKQDPASIITGQTAVSGALNLSSEGLFVQNNNGILEFKGLQAGTNITLTPSATGITISSTGGGGSSGVTYAEFNAYTGATETRLDGIEDDIVYMSGQTANKLNTSVFNGYTASTASVLTGLDNDINYLSGQTASKVNTSLFNSYTASTDVVIDNAITGATNVGNGVNVYGGLVPNRLLGFRTLNVTSPLSITSGATEITIGYTGTSGGGAGVTLEYKFDSTIGGAPSSKFFRLNNASASGATSVSFNYTTNNSVDASTILLAIKAGAKLYVQQLADSDEAVLYNVTADPVDNGTYVTFTVTLQSSGVDASFTNNQAFGIIITPTGSYVTTSTFNTYTGSTETRLDGIDDDINYISGITGTKLNTSIFNSYTASTETRLDGIEDDIVYLSGQTNLKLNTSIFNAYTGATDPILDGAITGVTAGANLSAVQTGRVVNITFTGSTGGGGITGATNVGSTGEGVFKAVNGDNLEFKKIKVSAPLTISGGTNEVHIRYTGATGGGGSYLPLSGGTVTGLTDFSAGASAYGDIVSITGTTTLSSTHVGKTIEANGTFTITFPNSLVTGAKINVINVGSGTITLAATTTLQSKSSNTKLASQYGGASVYHRGSNVWLAVGDLTA